MATMAINRHDDASSSEADSYERATAFLVGWIENSLLVPPSRPQPPQPHRPFSQSQSLADLPLPASASGTLRRRITVSNDDNINSLMNSLQTSINGHHQNQNRPTQQHRSRVGPNVSPTGVGVGKIFQKGSSSRRGRGAIPPLPFPKGLQQPSTSTSSSSNPPGRDHQRGGVPSMRSASAAPSRHSDTDPCSSLRRSSSSGGDRRRSRSIKKQADSVGQVDTLIQPQVSIVLPNTSTSSPKSSPVPYPVPAVEKEVVIGAANAASRKIGGERRSSSLTSNRPSKTKPARQKSRRHTIDTEGKPSTTTNKPSSSAASLSLDHISKLDGPNFDLGDTFLSPQYQIIEPNPSKALHLVKQLRIHDFAWVRRSSHEWTYAIIADFPVESGEGTSIRFVIDKLGKTKTFEMKHWAKCIRLVDDKSQSKTRC